MAWEGQVRSPPGKSKYQQQECVEIAGWHDVVSLAGSGLKCLIDKCPYS